MATYKIPLSAYDIECIETVRALIEKDLGKRYTIEALASIAGMSPTKLKGGFKVYYGLNVFAYVKAKRMNLAYELVCNSHYSLKKIAQMTGYKYLSHFNTAFKRRFLVTARRMRRGLNG